MPNRKVSLIGGLSLAVVVLGMMTSGRELKQLIFPSFPSTSNYNYNSTSNYNYDHNLSTAQQRQNSSQSQIYSPKEFQFDPDRHRLELLHIPKTGGTLLEVVGMRYNITWGACHFEFGWKRNEKNVLKDCPDSLLQTKATREALWHFPLHELDQMNLPFRPYDNLADERLRNKTKVFFMVVRNPYDRLVSLFYMHNRCESTKEAFNRWIVEGIQERLTTTHGNLGFIRYSTYLYRRDNANNRTYPDERIKYILHFERLEQEFKELVTSRIAGLNLTFPKEKINRLRCSIKKKDWERLSYRNFTKEALIFINKVYAEDFEIGGYSMADPDDIS